MLNMGMISEGVRKNPSPPGGGKNRVRSCLTSKFS